MSDAVIGAIVRAWARQREYAERLVADLTDADMVSQPVKGVVMNHPAWVFGHIGAYPPVLTAILKGEPFEDPLNHRYGRASRPSDDPREYPEKGLLMEEYLCGHDLLERTLASADPGGLTRPIPLPRWRDRFPLVGDAVVHLMISHESGHLGQVSAWRRAGGRAPV